MDAPDPKISGTSRRLNSNNVEGRNPSFSNDDEEAHLLRSAADGEVGATETKKESPAPPNIITRTGLTVLVLLAVQSCSKTLLMRFVMRDKPMFLTSAAVLGSECLKLTLSLAYILLVQRKSPLTVIEYLRKDARNTMLLCVPASAYNVQMSLEFVALANLSAAIFSVVVQTKMIFTAVFSFIVLKKRLRYLQLLGLVLLTTGVMLCNLKTQRSSPKDDAEAQWFKGIVATLGIATSSGFASVYTEKVIKGSANSRVMDPEDYGLAYTQVQLALMSLLTIGMYAIITDFHTMVEYGLWHNFTPAAFGSVLMSALGGLIVASVLKYADSILKNFATAISVIMTGILSRVLFSTELSVVYWTGAINVLCAILLYNVSGNQLEKYACGN